MIHCSCHAFNEKAVRDGIPELHAHLGGDFFDKKAGYLAKIIDRACRKGISAVDAYEQDNGQKENRSGCGTCLKPLAEMVEAYQNGKHASQTTISPGYSAGGQAAHAAAEHHI